MNRLHLAAFASLAFAAASTSHAALLSTGGPVSSEGVAAEIIEAPVSVADDAPGAENTHLQGFNEQQGVQLTEAITVDPAQPAGGTPGTIAAGTWVDSHMIFMNSAGSLEITHGSEQNPVTFTFTTDILGVMSDKFGIYEDDSTAQLGAVGTAYPDNFAFRGMEKASELGGVSNPDSYTYAGNTISLNSYVTEPGDWIRVVTASAVPLPAAAWLFGSALLGLVTVARRKQAQ